MLKRIVKEATSGFSSSGEQSSRRNKPTPQRRSASSDEASDSTQQRKSKRSSRSRDTKASAKTSARDDTEKARLKKSSRMKREPLLEYNVVETVHSAMHGKRKKRARQELLELFGSYDEEDTGFVDAEKFKKCIAKVGVRVKRAVDVDALVQCFAMSGGKEDAEVEDSSNANSSKARTKAVAVDYVAFIDFACNVRDSEKLSAVAVKLREVIRVYDDKHNRVTTVPYNVLVDLKKLDKTKRGWIASDRFSDFVQDHERPTFRLERKEIVLLTERFEYEYDKGTLGFDYQQFAQWLQPMLHLDMKELHARVKHLIEVAQSKGGWELDKLFEAIDHSGDGHVSGAELKQALLDMGLPLTDAQIQCLVEEYDIDGDGKIQYDEFVSLFQGTKKTRQRKQQDSDDDDDDDGASEANVHRRSKAKANVRNTFSWAINKAFARKHAQTNKEQKRDGKQRRKQDSPSSGEEANRGKKKRGPTKHKSDESESGESTTDVEMNKSNKRKSSHMRSKTVRTSSNASEESDRNQKKKTAKKKELLPRKKATSASKRNPKHSSTESDDVPKQATRRNREDSHRSKRQADSSDESSQDGPCERRRSKSTEDDGRKESIKRNQRTSSAATKRTQKISATRVRRARAESRARSGQAGHSVERSRRQGSRLAVARRSVSRSKPARNRTLDDDHDGDSHEDQCKGASSGSESGLDLEDVRKLQRQSSKRRANFDGNQSGDNSEDNGSESDEGEKSKSEQEYSEILRKSLRRAFEFFDTNRTDTIDKRELGHVLRALGHEYSSRELDREMNRADLDRNGELDFHEFYQFVKHQLVQKAYLVSKRREMEIRQAFQAVDATKSGCLDEHQFEFLVYKVLQVELSVEEQDALLDFVENAGDSTVHEDPLIEFMKTMDGFHKNGGISKKRQREMLENLDPLSRFACSAVKKLIRGGPMDLDKNLLMLLGVPTNFRPALTSADVCRDLQANSLQHALSFPCPETIVGLAQDPIRVSARKETNLLSLGRINTDVDEEEAKLVLNQAEQWQAHAIVSLKRATGVPKPFDTREEDVIKRCVHVALYQEQDDVAHKRQRLRRRARGRPSLGTIVGNVLEVPVYWNPQEEDVWEFSRKSTKEDKYKFLVRTNNVNDRLFLLVEFIVQLRTTNKLPKRQKHKLKVSEKIKDVHEMAACWCKIPVRALLAPRVEISRTKEKLWGGTVHSPIDIEEDEILRRRTGWRAITNAFKKPTPPAIGVKSAPIQSYSEEIQTFVRKMPPLIIAPFVSLPIVAEYMTAMQTSLWLKPHVVSSTLCEPVLKLLPQIIDDHEALSVFRRTFDTEMAGLKNGEDRQRKFQELVLRMWPSFVVLLEKLPATTLQDAKVTSTSTRRLSLLPFTGNGSTLAPAKGTTNQTPPDRHARFDLLQCTASGKLSLRNVPVAAAPFHIREIAFDRLI